jgi:general secretion pathway protein G
MKPLFLVLSLTIGAVAASGASPRAKFITARHQISDFVEGLEKFKTDCGRYPSTDEGLRALVNCPASVPTNQWDGPYLAYLIPVPSGYLMRPDPWGHNYIYTYPGKHSSSPYDIYSLGANGISKSAGDDPDDISNWDADSPHRTFLEDAPKTWPIILGVAILSFLTLSMTVWRDSRRSTLSSNLHGLSALLWLLTAIPTAIVLSAVPDGRIHFLVGWFALLGWWPPALFWTISGWKRGSSISKAFAAFTILAVVALSVWYLFFSVTVVG